MLSGDSTHCGARTPVLTVVLDQGRYQSAAAGPHSCKHTHIESVFVMWTEEHTNCRQMEESTVGRNHGWCLSAT